MRYCLEHDLAHLLVGETLPGQRSAVLWAIAHGEPTDDPMFQAEEDAAQALHWLLNLSGWPACFDALRAAVSAPSLKAN